MTFFKNITTLPISITLNGKRLQIPPGSVFDGPDQLSSYQGLKKTVDNKSNKVSKIDIKLPEKKNTIILQNKDSIENIQSNNSHLNMNIIHECDNTIQYISQYTKKPSLAICILSKDSFDLIQPCCESIFEEVHYDNTKIYIFDTGTTDKEVLNYYKELKNKKFIVTIVDVGSYNFSKNYNDGIKMVDTDYILIQNNDTVALNDYVSRLMKLIITNKVSACGPRMLYKNGRIQHDGQIFINNGLFTDPGHVNFNLDSKNVPSNRQEVDGITAAGILLKREDFLNCNGFDENYKDVYQDVDLNIKLHTLNKKIICDREANIIHYDNTSRKKLNTDIKQFFKEDRSYIESKLNKGLIKLKKKKNIKFSIVTLTHNKKQYTDFLNCIKKQKFNSDIEIIPLPNFNNEYVSCSEALNIGIDISYGEYIILCHQDLLTPDDWLFKIEYFINQFKNINWGVLGMAGTKCTSNINVLGATYLSNTNELMLSKKAYGNYLEVQTLDELCLIVKRSSKIRFDEKIFNHYHWYGADLCLQYISLGYKNYAINAPCDHLSNGVGNLINKDNRDIYRKQAIELFHKWKFKLKYFSTTTARFMIYEKIIAFFNYYLLKKQNINDFQEIEKIT